jgi:membrane-associated phospholipid phosphatase
MMSALMAYYPSSRWLRIGGYAAIAYSVAGVSAFGGGRMHWLSDGVAGALMGYAIGWTVGRQLRALADGQAGHSARLRTTGRLLAGSRLLGFSVAIPLEGSVR